MCAGRCVCRRGVQPYYFKISYTLSGIFGPLWGYLPRVIALVLSNNDTSCIADYKSRSQTGLPLFDTYVSGCSQGQDNKLDTYKVAQLGPNVLSRISQHLLGKLNVITGSPYWNDCQKPYAYFNLEDKIAQGPKTTNSNTYIMQPRDLTAYEYNLYLMRGRSFHSSATFACDHLAITKKGKGYFFNFESNTFASCLMPVVHQQGSLSATLLPLLVTQRVLFLFEHSVWLNTFNICLLPLASFASCLLCFSCILCNSKCWASPLLPLLPLLMRYGFLFLFDSNICLLPMRLRAKVPLLLALRAKVHQPLLEAQRQEMHK